MDIFIKHLSAIEFLLRIHRRKNLACKFWLLVESLKNCTFSRDGILKILRHETRPTTGYGKLSRDRELLGEISNIQF